MSELLGVLQQIIQESQEAAKPTAVAFGTVTSVSPLEILVDGTTQPKPTQALIPTDSVIAKSTQVQGSAVIINEGLTIGDKVVLLRVSQGQRYLVLSKVH